LIIGLKPVIMDAKLSETGEALYVFGGEEGKDTGDCEPEEVGEGLGVE
jgi:hypothetical protein